MANSALLVLFLAATAHQGLAIKCYQCTTKTNPECVSPNMLSDLKPTECTPNMQWSPKNMNDVLPSGVTKFFDSVSSSIGSIASSIPVEMVCMKSNVKAGDEMVIMRYCAASITTGDDAAKESSVCDQVKKSADGKADYCSICNTDGCNGASGVKVFSLLMLAPLLAVFYNKLA